MHAHSCIFNPLSPPKTQIMASLQRPKKITFVGSDGKEYPFLAKPKDDLRKDYRCDGKARSGLGVGTREGMGCVQVWGMALGKHRAHPILAKPQNNLCKDCSCAQRGGVKFGLVLWGLRQGLCQGLGLAWKEYPYLIDPEE